MQLTQVSKARFAKANASRSILKIWLDYRNEDAPISISWVAGLICLVIIRRIRSLTRVRFTTFWLVMVRVKRPIVSNTSECNGLLWNPDRDSSLVHCQLQRWGLGSRLTPVRHLDPPNSAPLGSCFEEFHLTSRVRR